MFHVVITACVTFVETYLTLLAGYMCNTKRDVI